MFSQKEIDNIRNKRRRLRNEPGKNEVNSQSLDENDDQNSLKLKKSQYDYLKEPEPLNDPEYGKGVKSLDEEFVDELGKMAESEEKVEDPWLKSLKVSETDDTQIVYERNTKEPKKSSKMDFLYDLPKVELIRQLVSKLKDGQSPADYLKSKDFKDANRVCSNDPSTYEVSDLAHVLTMTWQNVYFMTREDIVDSLLSFKNNGKELKSYEFRWVKDELAIHGPYQHEDILLWIVYNYVSESNPILLRELDSEGNPITKQWVNYKDSDVFNIFPVNRESKLESNDLGSDVNKEDDESEGDEDDGFTTRKKPKLIGLRVKDDSAEYEESDDDQVE